MVDNYFCKVRHKLKVTKPNEGGIPEINLPSAATIATVAAAAVATGQEGGMKAIRPKKGENGTSESRPQK